MTSTAQAAEPIPTARHRNSIWYGLQLILQNVFVFWHRYRARGLEHLPEEGGALLLINHQSFLDPLFVGLPLQRPVSYIARDNLFVVPVIGWILKKTYVMPISRESAGTEIIRHALRRLDDGYLVGMFPEGTRTRTGELGSIKPGFLALVRRTEAPIIPVGIAGAFEAFPRGSILPRPSPVSVVFGPPLDPDLVRELSQRGREREFVALVETGIRECLSEAEAWRSRKS